MLTSLLVVAAIAAGASAPPVSVCSIVELRQSPGYRWRVERIADMVDGASRIVRVKAITADSTAHTVTFEPLEWIRDMTPHAGTMTLPGVAVDHDDLNDGPVPYQMVRSAGQRGDCFAEEYRLGAQYLLLLQDGTRWGPIHWWPLAPVNEQLRGDDDPWLAWVRERATKRPPLREDTNGRSAGRSDFRSRLIRSPAEPDAPSPTGKYDVNSS
jgi:hypothetical protein